MATHSSNLAWRIPWTEEPDRLQSRGSKKSDMSQQLNNNNSDLTCYDAILNGVIFLISFSQFVAGTEKDN